MREKNKSKERTKNKRKKNPDIKGSTSPLAF